MRRISTMLVLAASVALVARAEEAAAPGRLGPALEVGTSRASFTFPLGQRALRRSGGALLAQRVRVPRIASCAAAPSAAQPQARSDSRREVVSSVRCRLHSASRSGSAPYRPRDPHPRTAAGPHRRSPRLWHPSHLGPGAPAHAWRRGAEHPAVPERRLKPPTARPCPPAGRSRAGPSPRPGSTRTSMRPKIGS